ncbi:hypothetical protein C1645_731473 [Glomus cerebriforme]|uniref:Uncharacterized protein n=1 Tax=Glomus cerebriforme TaxID=658196 RepID=A0A397TQA3_9GLOM|nr:hypothetical protein C1645_731473 [Glomus cerebriforme]
MNYNKEKKLKYVKSRNKWFDAKRFKEKWDDVKYFNDRKAILLNLEDKPEKELLKKLGRENKLQVVIIDRVDGREIKKSNEGHKASYKTLNEEKYRDMIKMFKEHQNVYENEEKYRKVGVKNDNKS